MKKNLGNADKIIRILIAIAVAILYFTEVITGTAGLIVVIFGAILFVTALVGFCPIYWPIGLSTRKKE